MRRVLMLTLAVVICFGAAHTVAAEQDTMKPYYVVANSNKWDVDRATLIESSKVWDPIAQYPNTREIFQVSERVPPPDPPPIPRKATVVRETRLVTGPPPPPPVTAQPVWVFVHEKPVPPIPPTTLPPTAYKWVYQVK